MGAPTDVPTDEKAGNASPPRWPLVVAIAYLGLTVPLVAWLLVRWQGRFP